MKKLFILKRVYQELVTIKIYGIKQLVFILGVKPLLVLDGELVGQLGMKN